MSYSHEIVVRPNRGWVRIDWRSVLEFKDLLFLLVWRDFTVKHRQTILGPLWSILTPLMTTLVFTVVFGQIARIPTNGLPPVLFYFCGLLGWNYFAQTLQQTAFTFVSNADILGKVAFPRLILPLSVAVSNLLTFGIQLLTISAFWIYFKFATESGQRLALQPATVLFPFLLLHAAALALGVGLWIAAITVRYRDLLHAISLLVQLWMYATPVIYPLSEAPERYRWLIALNPMAMVVEGFRYLLLGQGHVTPALYAYSLAVAVVSFFSGVAVFQKTERTFIDTI